MDETSRQFLDAPASTAADVPTDEFPPGAGEWIDPVSRRNFLRLAGASLALAGVAGAGCSRHVPTDQVVPYVQQPEQMDPGKPMFFASTMPFDGYGRGVLVLSREGRPIKIEGNPDHPASLGGTDVFMQASILDLYDPDRARTVTQAGLARPVSDFIAQLSFRLRDAAGGKGVRILTRTITSPTMVAQIEEVRSKFPEARWHAHDPMPAGPAGVFDQPADVVYDLTNAKVIVSLDSDFLFSEPGSLQYARQFSDGRRVRRDRAEMNRLYVAEPTLSITGSKADHRLPVDSMQLRDIAGALSATVNGQEAREGFPLAEHVRRWAQAAGADLKSAGPGKSVVIPGRFQSPLIHTLAHRINQALGNVGKTVRCIDSVAATGAGSLAELTDDIRAGKVSLLLILDGNPVYDAPADVAFSAALADLSARVAGSEYAALTAHLSTHYNETSYCCQWHLPMAHWLESWGDARAFDGTASLTQPLIAPLYGGMTASELLDIAIGPARGGQAILRDFWKQYAPGDFKQWWLQTLQTGVVAGSAFPARPMPKAGTPATESGSNVEVIFRPDPAIWNGDFANNAWLQELPKPFTKLTWDNAIGLSVATTQRLGVIDGDMVRLAAGGRQLDGPAMLIPGQADSVVALSLGYGRSRGGAVLADEDHPRGYNAYSLRMHQSPWISPSGPITPLGRSMPLAIAQNHHAMTIEPGVPGVPSFLKPEAIASLGMSEQDLAIRNRKLIRTVTLQQYRADPRFMDKLAPDERKPLLSLFPQLPKSADLQWGMVIDTAACIGCNACVIGCQAENNIPVVGKTEVMREREMHWIRIDEYFAGESGNPSIYHQPVPCMHCENAPCEIVCPVGATTHSPEGINEMTYNRCVGTRFCSNNCPYKVRRFNYLLYSDFERDSRSLQYNPDVSVRSRGVMEKCTYCVQRVDRTRIEAQAQASQLRLLASQASTDAERQRLEKQADDRARQIVRGIQTACQQACPTSAIFFGDIADSTSDVARLKAEPGNYVLLWSLTTQPRTSYLANVSNPNPALAGEGSA